MTYCLEFSIQGLPLMTNGIRGHWAKTAREARYWRSLSAWSAREHKRPTAPLTRALVTLTRHSSAEPDFDGLVSAMKPILDGLVDAGVIANDKPSCIAQPKYSWIKAKRGQGRITVKVEGAE